MARVQLALSLIGVLALQVMCNASAAEHASNPIRQGVTMLQMMQKKVPGEGEKEKALNENTMCYCKNGKAVLTKAVADAGRSIPAAQSDIEQIIALCAARGRGGPAPEGSASG